VIAERTLFLPSVGFIIAIAVLLADAIRPGRTLAPTWRRVGLAGFGLLLGAGIVRSTLRLVDWRTPVIWSVTSLELAPLSWRTHLAYASRLVLAGDTAEARRQVKLAIALRTDDPLVVKTLADYGRLTGGTCSTSRIEYEEVLLVAPQRSDARGSLVACLAYMGLYQEARDAALEGCATRGRRRVLPGGRGTGGTGAAGPHSSRRMARAPRGNDRHRHRPPAAVSGKVRAALLAPPRARRDGGVASQRLGAG